MSRRFGPQLVLARAKRSRFSWVGLGMETASAVATAWGRGVEGSDGKRRFIDNAAVTKRRSGATFRFCAAPHTERFGLYRLLVRCCVRDWGHDPCRDRSSAHPTEPARTGKRGMAVWAAAILHTSRI